MNRNRKHLRIVASISGSAVVACIVFLLLSLAGCSQPAPGTFASPEEAVQALHDSIGSDDKSWIEEIFGPGSLDLFNSGDGAQDHQDGQRVKEMIAEKVEFDEIDADAVVALIGDDAWPFPIPLVQHDSRWRFDTEAGRDELLNRRIGLNELWTLASLHEYVNAQFEYAAVGRDGNTPAFAQRVRSSEGLHDGLFWGTAEGEPLSPLGDLLAAAETVDPDADPLPFHGYYFRILTGQGPNAPGGEMNYLDGDGRMTGGFAAIAWPAKYDNSGVMTFIINRRDIVFEKDLGEETAALAAGIQLFDPDASWSVTADNLEDFDTPGGPEGEQASQ